MSEESIRPDNDNGEAAVDRNAVDQQAPAGLPDLTTDLGSVENRADQNLCESEVDGQEPAPPKPVDDPQTFSSKSVFLMTLTVEGGMLLVAVLVGLVFAFHDPQQPLGELSRWPWISSLAWGTLAALPLFFGAIGMSKMNWGKEFSDQVERLLKQMFANISVPGLVFISLMAGLCEEMMFRWCLQGGLEKVFTFPGAWLVALCIASIIFGLLHWINRTYALLTTIAGFYLGLLMSLSGTVLVPIFTHAIYDFLALYWITRAK